MDAIHQDLDKGLVGTQLLLSGIKLVDESSRYASEFTDKRYLPFYYHLGKYIQPKSVVQIGPRLGLPAACFLQSNKAVQEWCVLGKFDRFVSSNIRLHGVPVNFTTATDQKFDMVMLSERGSVADLNVLWSCLNSEGLLIVDYIGEDAQGNLFRNFCKVVNRDHLLFDTRYGVGIIKK